MYDLGFLQYAMLNIESIPVLLQTAQLPSSELMSLVASKITAPDDNNCNVWWNSGKPSPFYTEIR
jgi:hypothetical protein